jgi:hypothetical protein
MAGAGLKKDMAVAKIPEHTAILASFYFYWMASWKFAGAA